MTTLANVLEQAEAAAADYSANTNTAGALTAVSAPAAGALAPLGKPSVDSFVNSGGLSVDQFLNVKPSGVRLGDSKAHLDTIPVVIDMLDVTPLYVCRIEIGGNTTFYKSYDGAVTPKGENFQQLIEVRGRSPGAKSSGIYQSVEIPAELAEDLKDGKGALIAEAGTTIGFTPSLTGFKEFQSFYKRLAKSNPELCSARVRVNLNAKQRSNKNGNDWYVLEFEYVGPAED